MPLEPYVSPTPYSDQAEVTSRNPLATGIRMRTLIELQVISHLLSRQMGDAEDLHLLRQSIADSMISG